MDFVQCVGSFKNMECISVIAVNFKKVEIELKYLRRIRK